MMKYYCNMTIRLLTIFMPLLLTNLALAENAITFNDGSKVSFYKLLYISGSSETRRGFGGDGSRALWVDFEGVRREIPWAKVVSLKILKYEKFNSDRVGWMMKNVEAEQTTSTGVTY